MGIPRLLGWAVNGALFDKSALNYYILQTLPVFASNTPKYRH